MYAHFILTIIFAVIIISIITAITIGLSELIEIIISITACECLCFIVFHCLVIWPGL